MVALIVVACLERVYQSLERGSPGPPAFLMRSLCRSVNAITFHDSRCLRSLTADPTIRGNMRRPWANSQTVAD